MSILSLNLDLPLRNAVLLVCMNGWVNAGGVATLVAQALGGKVVGRGDPDQLFDYRVSRPLLDFEDGVMTALAWPELVIRQAKFGDRDLLILSGVEPNWNWRRLGSEVSDLVVGNGVTQQISIGAVPWAWPHTRPVPIIATASHPALLRADEEHASGLLRVPAAAVSALDFVVAGSGVPTYGFYARVPQYVNVEFHAAALAVIKRLEDHLGIDLPGNELAAAAAVQREELDAVAADRSEVSDLVKKLEAMVDAAQAVSGEQLAAEIERFLRERPDQGTV